jgi:hypothetical protein
MGEAKETSSNPSFKPKLVKFNFGTPKFHFLGDYASTIRLYRTTDSYSTQSVRGSMLVCQKRRDLSFQQGELMHRLPKRWYRRTSKVNPRRGVLKYERKVARIREIRRRVSGLDKASSRVSEELEDQVLAAHSMPDIHHYIGRSEKVSVSVKPATSVRDQDEAPYIPSGKVSSSSSLIGI